MREHKKKWLFDKGKTSGSRKHWSYGGDFANERNTKQFRDLEDAPKKAGMKTGHVFNNRLSFRPLRRFLKTKVGKNWNEVYSEIKERIPQDIWETHKPIEWYVSTKIEIEASGRIVDTNGWGVSRVVISEDGIKCKYGHYSYYYVHPETNILCKLEPSANGKKKLSKKEGRTKYVELKKSIKKRKEGWEKEQQDKSDVAAKVMKEKKQKKNDIQKN